MFDAMQANIASWVYSCAPLKKKTSKSLRNFMLMRPKDGKKDE